MIQNGISKHLKNSCKCANTKKNKKIVAPVGCSDDDFAVAVLPNDWVPKHGGPILAKYLKQREIDHDKILNDIIKGATVVKDDIESRIRTLAENLLTHIKVNQYDINSLIKMCDTGEGFLKKETRDDALNRINKLIVQRINDMATFKREALALERQRAEGLKKVLRDEFQRLISVGHKTPKDLLHDVDEQIYEINQQLLNNSRAYSELIAHLRVQADESIVRARISLNQLCLPIEKEIRGHSALSRAKEGKVNTMHRSTSVNKCHSEVDNSIDNLSHAIEEVDSTVSLLVQAYRTSVFEVFTLFSSKLTGLEKDLNSPDLIDSAGYTHVCDIAELQAVIDRTLNQLSNSKYRSKSFLELAGSDEIVMKRSLLTLVECLQDTYSILHNAGHLWDAHILRSALVQKLTIAAVEDQLTNHDTAELAQEITFNIALEQMKSLSDVDKINYQCTAVVVMLDHIAEMYTQHSQIELGRLEEFMNLPVIMANILLSEFEVFLELHPRSVCLTRSNDTGQSHLELRKANSTTAFLPLPRAILQTELQEIALKNWRNGFLESFQNNVSLVPEELRHQAQLWVEKRAVALYMRYSLKMVSHSVRTERVKAACAARLAEVRYHDTRLNSHLNAIYDLVDNLPLEASEFGALNAPFLYPLGTWLDRIETEINSLPVQDIDSGAKHLKMKSYACRLAKHRQLFEQSLDVAIAEHKRHIECRIQEARVSNVRFMSEIKLLHEGGRYSALEAIRTSNCLMRGSEALECCITRAVENVNRRRGQLLALVEHAMLPLQRALGDAVKSDKVPDKRTNKKK